jgi:hypothetical protein
MFNRNAAFRLARAVGTALAIGSVPGLAHAQNAQEEVDKQVAKLIGDAISSRVAARAAEDAGAEKNSLWGSYTRLKVDLPAFPGTPAIDSKSDVGIVGYDREISQQWLAGVSASYSDTSGFDSNSWSVSPYLAYRFTPALFAIGSLTYGRSEFSTSTPTGLGSVATTSGDTEAWGAALSLNGLYRSNNWLAKGRAEVSWTRSESDTGTFVPASTFTLPFGGAIVVPAFATTSSSTDHTTRGSLDGEVGYLFGPGWYGYGGLQASVTDSSDSYQLFGRLGLEYRFAKTASFGVKYEQKIDDNANFDIDVYSFTAVLRVAF